MKSENERNLSQQKKMAVNPPKMKTSAAQLVNEPETQNYQRSQLLKTEQAAKKLNVHPSTLEKGRQSHRKDLFPPSIKIGKSVRYCEKAIDAWIEKNTIHVGDPLA